MLDVDQITDDMWDLMTRCWKTDPRFRPTCRQIIQNAVEQGVLTGEREEMAQEGFVHENARFLDAMRRKADVSIDLAQIELILKEVCVFNRIRAVYGWLYLNGLYFSALTWCPIGGGGLDVK